ncbi:mitochondrial ribosomal death-associated protein 3-domain-containing protein [Vararia minispora EC-137]|uniref:Mitochondrial ribosomal death-associated protein 3-domain-containing protein n=1 Tax=Vararia minispora EC-137 TaxID=1314806 RepID=A0ACB8QLZ9_9AGAM|nr:mitochondrial ribosomal death-associated protein 3-domain-containing protein [Vararia minispora EC-137]
MLSSASIPRSRALNAPAPFLCPAGSLIQCRHKSKASTAKQMIAKIRAKERKEVEKAAGGRIFRPLPAARNLNAVFDADQPEELILPTFSPLKGIDEIKGELTPQDAGKAFSLPYRENDPCRKFGVPRNLVLDFRLLAKPATIIRDVTMTMFQNLQRASNEVSNAHSYVLYGEPGCGKSYTLLQCAEWAHGLEWLVLYIPRATQAITLVNSSTPYQYDIRTMTYAQPGYAAQILTRFLTVNEKLLNRIKTIGNVHLDESTKLPSGTSYAELIRVSLQRPSVVPSALWVILEELGKQIDYPVMLAVDDFQALFCTSKYRDPMFHGIKAWHLSIPRLLLEYFSGRKSFKRGAVVGALSTSNTTFNLSPQVRHALGIQPELGVDPFTTIAPEIRMYTKGIRAVEVPGQLGYNEAASMFEVWMKNKTLHTRENDDLFLSKYTESGGNPREFVWQGLLNTLQT